MSLFIRAIRFALPTLTIACGVISLTSCRIRRKGKEKEMPDAAPLHPSIYKEYPPKTNCPTNTILAKGRALDGNNPIVYYHIGGELEPQNKNVKYPLKHTENFCVYKGYPKNKDIELFLKRQWEKECEKAKKDGQVPPTLENFIKKFSTPIDKKYIGLNDKIKPTDPATFVSFKLARKFCKSKSGRLPVSKEVQQLLRFKTVNYVRESRNPNFQNSPFLWYVNDDRVLPMLTGLYKTSKGLNEIIWYLPSDKRYPNVSFFCVADPK